MPTQQTVIIIGAGPAKELGAYFCQNTAIVTDATDQTAIATLANAAPFN